MTIATADGYLSFTTSTGGGVVTPSGNFVNSDVSQPVNDTSSDGNADTGTPSSDGSVDTFGATHYTGYTMEIRGNDYAVFVNANGLGLTCFIPYFDAVDDLSDLHGTAPPTPTFEGNNADVVNLCFLEGTRIATPGGDVRVEDLSIGDPVRTADGRAVPVKWIGRQLVTTPANVTHSERSAPVRIAAGALGDGVPHTDLYVTADHGMILDGLVINASALINGSSIDWMPMDTLPPQVTYYHIESEGHEVILANGAAAETFVDVAGRRAFDNYGEYLELYGAERIIPEMDRPRISSARLVPDAIRARLGIVDEVTGVDQPLSA